MIFLLDWGILMGELRASVAIVHHPQRALRPPPIRNQGELE